MLYQLVLKPILFKFDPEAVHDSFISFGKFLGRYRLLRGLIDLIYGYHGPDISKTIDGLYCKTPFLLSAGFDYNGYLAEILPSIGLGGEEVGSVTARPCAGNPRPRLTRLPKSRSIIVNKGLRNDGVDAIIKRLKHTPCAPGFVLGVSIARTNDEQVVTSEAGIEDYAYSFRRLNEEGIGDYYALNISCPNAFGGETFATPALLERLLRRIKSIPCARPVYIKLPINLAWNQFSNLLAIIDKMGFHGVIIGNLNKNYHSLRVRGEAPESYRGGLSGEPCRSLSVELIRKTRELYGRRFTILGVGGVDSPEAAREKLAAGADLVELITGLIYEGPSLIKHLARAVL